MTNSQKWLLLCGALALGAFAFADPPAALNNELRFSRSDESTFIEATRPQVIGSGKYGTDAGRLYIATDGGWRRLLVEGDSTTYGAASTADAGLVTAFDQQLGGIKSLRDGLIIDGGSTYSAKFRSGICLAAVEANIGNLSACQGMSLTTVGTGGQINFGGIVDLLAAGFYMGSVPIFNGVNGTPAISLYGTGWLQIAGWNTASAPTCSGGTNAKGIGWDIDKTTLVFCDGVSGWQPVSGNRGSITLSGGTGTATVRSGSTCVCSDSTAVAAVQCSVSSTTLTANGTGTDVIKYICL